MMFSLHKKIVLIKAFISQGIPEVDIRNAGLSQPRQRAHFCNQSVAAGIIIFIIIFIMIEDVSRGTAVTQFRVCFWV